MLARVSPALMLAFATAAVPALASAQQVAYTPGVSHYRVTLTATGVAEQMGQKQDLSYDTHQSVTLTITPKAADTLAYTMTVDSIGGNLPNGMPMDGSAAVGLKVTATMSPLGRIYSKQVPHEPGREAFAQAAEELVRFLPPLPKELRTGITWSDTSKGPMQQMGLALDRTIIANYKVVGDTVYDGEKSWRIERTSATTLAGSGSTMGQAVTINTTSTGTGTLYVSYGGVFLGGNATEHINSKASLVAQNVDLTSTQTQVARIARVK